MRPYRAIPIGKKDFVYGWYYYNQFANIHQILVPLNATTYDRLEVIPESVGQSTGLKNKKGTEIYEGDILQTVTEDGTRLSKFEVYWREGAAGFAKKRDDMEHFHLGRVACKHLEVIGDIHHPELMQGREDERNRPH